MFKRQFFHTLRGPFSTFQRFIFPHFQGRVSTFKKRFFHTLRGPFSTFQRFIFHNCRVHFCTFPRPHFLHFQMLIPGFIFTFPGPIFHIYKRLVHFPRYEGSFSTFCVDFSILKEIVFVLKGSSFHKSAIGHWESTNNDLILGLENR